MLSCKQLVVFVGVSLMMGDLYGRENRLLRHASRTRYAIVEKKKLQCQLKLRAADCLVMSMRAYDKGKISGAQEFAREAYVNLLQLSDMTRFHRGHLTAEEAVERARQFVKEVGSTYFPSLEFQPDFHCLCREVLEKFIVDEVCDQADAAACLCVIDDLLRESIISRLMKRANIGESSVDGSHEKSIPGLVKAECEIFCDYYRSLQEIIYQLDAAFGAYLCEDKGGVKTALQNSFRSAQEYVTRAYATFCRCRSTCPEIIFRGIIGGGFLDRMSNMVNVAGESEEVLFENMGSFLVLCFSAVAAGLPYNEGFEEACRPIIEEWVTAGCPHGFPSKHLADFLRRRLVSGVILGDPLSQLLDGFVADDGTCHGVGDAVLVAYRVIGGDGLPWAWRVASFVIGRDFAPFVGFESGIQFQKPDQLKTFFLPARSGIKFRFRETSFQNVKDLAVGTCLKVEDSRGCLRIVNVVEKADEGLVTVKEFFGADPGEEIELEVRLIDVVEFKGTDEERKHELLQIGTIELFVDHEQKKVTKPEQENLDQKHSVNENSGFWSWFQHKELQHAGGNGNPE